MTTMTYSENPNSFNTQNKFYPEALQGNFGQQVCCSNNDRMKNKQQPWMKTIAEKCPENTRIGHIFFKDCFSKFRWQRFRIEQDTGGLQDVSWNLSQQCFQNCHRHTFQSLECYMLDRFLPHTMYDTA